MDSEENLKIQKAQAEGRSETDEGPDYHVAWWESYKGIGKGYLGGSIIGTAIGTAIGATVATTLALTIGIGTTALTPLMAGIGITGAFAAAGMAYGAHQFSDIGKIVGSGAAIAEKQEERDKARFKLLEKKIDDLKGLITGKKSTIADEEVAEAKAIPDDKHRTTHCDEHCDPKAPFIFKKVAAIGLVTVVAAGALLAAGGLNAEVTHGLFAGHVAETYAAAMATMGAFGASFGINRDSFRAVFDKTDRWFRGIVSESKGKAPEIGTAPQIAQTVEKKPETTLNASANRIITVHHAHLEYPESETFHRDKLAYSQILLTMDHSKAKRQ